MIHKLIIRLGFSAFFILFFSLFFLNFTTELASAEGQEQESVTIEFFWGDGCPHCKKAEPFLADLARDDERVILQKYEVYNSPTNYELMLKRTQELGITDFGVPLTIIGEEYVVGYLSDETTGANIKAIIESQLGAVANNTPISIPFFPNLNLKDLSLPLLAVLLGAIDGFNPCAMWALIFLLGILINMKDRRKLVILGSVFIITSGAMYFLFMTAWLNIFLVLGYISIIRLGVGLFALGIGGYYLREYWRERNGGCEKIDKAKRTDTFTRLKKAINSQNMFLAIVGIMLLAVSVNLIELLCSAGLPAIFTNILSLSELDWWQYYSLIFIYILFFILDDLIIFFGAVFTARVIGIQSKYTRLSRLIGGILMLLIGIILILKPEWLLFG